MDVFDKRRAILTNIKKVRRGGKTLQTPDGFNQNVFIQCPHCKSVNLKEKMEEKMWVCPKCEGYIKFYARKRVRTLLDPGFVEIQGKSSKADPLDFPGYLEKIEKAQETTNLDDALVVAEGAIKGNPCIVIAMEARFMMGSMGSYVGEEIVKAFKRAGEKQIPVIAFSASGGARMQEGIFSLMQMAKTSNAVREFDEAGGLYISVLTDPTTGGVMASFATLADIILAEPKALLGFTGPRVIQQTINQELPEGFQRSEFLLEHGFIDAIVSRKEMRGYLAKLLELHRV